mgnify:CR=1 FL=1
MNQKKVKLPIDALIKHLKEHKDAVVILGPDILEDTKYCEITEETYDSYNRKLMIKDPNKFWNYYVTNVMLPLSAATKASSQINKLLGLNIHSIVIDTNIVKTVMNDGKRDDLISPNGKNNILECVKCHEKYEAEHMLDDIVQINKPLKCKCGGNLVLSVSKGSVTKYLEISQELVNRYPVSHYLKQRLEIQEYGINSLFESDKSKQSSLDVFF